MFNFNLYTIVQSFNHSIQLSSKLLLSISFPPQNTNHKQRRRPAMFISEITDRKANPARALVSQSWIENWIVWEANLSTNCLKKQLWERIFSSSENIKIEFAIILKLIRNSAWNQSRPPKNIWREKETSLFVFTTKTNRVVCPGYLKIFLREKEMSIFVWVPNGRPGIDNKC